MSHMQTNQVESIKSICKGEVLLVYAINQNKRLNISYMTACVACINTILQGKGEMLIN